MRCPECGRETGIELASVETTSGKLTFWASWYGWAALWLVVGLVFGARHCSR